ncbi:MAG: hypothetical protein ACFFDN_47635, partial [Candidatus Hodarchaeota archaeon]
MDRDENANNDEATNNIDFVIIRRAISSSQAMQVLELLLTCYVNESIDELTNMTVYEEAVLYTYVSTKINGTKAVKLNLNVDVLGYVPYFSDYQNSKQGQEPDNRSKYTAEFILIVVGIIVGIVACAVVAVYSGGATAIVMVGLICLLIYMLDAYLPGVVEILTMIKMFLMELVMTVLTWLGPLGWLILRAALLAMIWMEFAITLAMVAIGFLIMLPFLSLLFEAKGFTTNYNANYLSTQKDDMCLTIEYYITLEYINFWDFDIPSISISYTNGDLNSLISINYFAESLIIPPEDILFALNASAFEDFPKNSDDYNNFLAGWAFAMGTFGSLIGLSAGISAAVQFSKIRTRLTILFIAISGIFFILGWVLMGDSLPKILGLILGIIISMFLTSTAIIRESHNMAKNFLNLALIFAKIAFFASLISMILSAFGFFIPESSLLINIIQIILGFASLIGGISMLHVIQNSDDRKSIAFTFFLIELFTLLTIVDIALNISK